MDKVRAVCDRIEQRLRVVTDIEDGASVTVFAVLAAVLYSEVEDAEAMRRLVHSRVHERKERMRAEDAGQ
jgi:hypothetical protein